MNQRVASSVLERRGHVVVCAANGREALSLFDRSADEPFDLILMDVQMPDMDGLEATAEIRRLEAGTGNHIPIIALTARAMTGDREECIEAGMDEYLSKPIRTAELYDLIADFCNTDPSEATVTELRSGDSPGVIDIKSLLTLVGGNRQLLSNLAVMFSDESVTMLEKMRASIDAGDDSGLQSVAHTLKGSAATMTGYTVSRTAAELEISQDGNIGHRRMLLERLEVEVRALNTALEQLTLRKAG